MESNFDTIGKELAAAKHHSYRGLARISLAALNFNHCLGQPSGSDQHREALPKNIIRLHQIFSTEGCHRFDNENYIRALVPDEVLESALAQSGLNPTSLCTQDDGSIPYLEIEKVDCLHGLHRSEAAKAYLDDNDQWWTVELYSSALCSEARRSIVESYPNSLSFSDGEIFWKIRFYHHRGDVTAEKKWWARLTSTKRKELKQLLQDERLCPAFDRLIEFPGLWRPIQLGVLHRLLTLKCDEEMLHYLEHIHSVWSTILDGVPKSAADSMTVEQLQCLAPATSTEDLDGLTRLMELKLIFPKTTTGATRRILLNNLSRVSCLIPSLWTFFENLKYLEPCCMILKRLVNMKRKKTIRKAFYASYFQPSRCIVPTRANEKRYVSSKSLAEDRWLGYQQLWLFAMRHWPRMTNFDPRKECGKEKPDYRQNHALWHELGALAAELGFRSSTAMQLKVQDPNNARASQCLEDAELALLKEDDEYVKPIARILERASQACNAQHASPHACLTSSGPGPTLDHRCGRPFDDSYASNRQNLFLPSFSDNNPASGRAITSFFVQRDFFHSFFGVEITLDGREIMIQTEDSVLTLDSDVALTSPTLVGRVQELERENTALQNQLRDCRVETSTEVESLRSQLDIEKEKSLVEKERLQNECQERISQIREESRQQNAATLEEITRLEKQIEVTIIFMEEQQNSSAADHAQLHRQILDLNEARERLQQDNEIICREMEIARDAYRDEAILPLQQEIVILKEQIQDLNEMNRMLRTNESAGEAKVAQLLEDNQHLRCRIAELPQEVCSSALVPFQEENQALREEGQMIISHLQHENMSLREASETQRRDMEAEAQAAIDKVLVNQNTIIEDIINMNSGYTNWLESQNDELRSQVLQNDSSECFFYLARESITDIKSLRIQNDMPLLKRFLTSALIPAMEAAKDFRVHFGPGMRYFPDLRAETVHYFAEMWSREKSCFLILSNQASLLKDFLFLEEPKHKLILPTTGKRKLSDPQSLRIAKRQPPRIIKQHADARVDKSRRLHHRFPLESVPKAQKGRLLASSLLQQASAHQLENEHAAVPSSTTTELVDEGEIHIIRDRPFEIVDDDLDNLRDFDIGDDQE